MFNTPILYLIFNRPELTEITFPSICKIKPKKLFIAADGPRFGNINDQINCKLVRDFVLSKIDWDCEVNTLFRNQNLGCGKAVSSAISWFFSNVEAGIILEDDCFPDKSFFRFCEELLENYKNDDDVMTISGSNLYNKNFSVSRNSYYFGLGGIWGWATWKSSWEHYDFKMSKWSDPLIKKKISDYLKTDEWIKFYFPMFEDTFKGKIDTWDVQWLFAVLSNNALSINPGVNLVRNIGFGLNATHTTNNNNPIHSLNSTFLNFPLIKPNQKKIDYDKLILIYNYINSKKSKKKTLVDILLKSNKIFLSTINKFRN